MSHAKTTYTNLKPLKSPKFFKLDAGGKSKIRNHVFSFMHQAIATVVIFLVFFLIMNWGAISQIASWEYEKFSNKTDQINPLYKLVEQKQVHENPLPLVKTSAEAQHQIPNLDLSIAPPDTRLVIPRINRNVPVMNVSSEALITKDWDKLETDMQSALQYGVIHYPGTAYPGQQGNIVITGHSSYFPWDPGRFKDVFAVLHDLRTGDKMLLYYNQQQYIYEVENIKKIWPSQLDVLKATPDNRLTLITCTPVGTNLQRLVVEAKLLGMKP